MQGTVDPNAVTINIGDLMEVIKDLDGPNLDLILHTPGGSPEAVESLVRYIRTKFTHIRAFIPLAAMSAGTMWALACDEIVMVKHSQLGPIDPQFALAFGEQIRLAPAQAILDQFKLADEACSKDPSKLAVWLPILRSYGPSLLQECYRARALSESLVSQWLAAYMLKDGKNPAGEADSIAKKFADYTVHQSHSRPIDRDLARGYGVKITDLEADPDLQDAVLSVHHSTVHTLSGTPATKIVENQLGRAYVVIAQTVLVQHPSQTPPPPTAPPVPDPLHIQDPDQARSPAVRGRPNAARRRRGR